MPTMPVLCPLGLLCLLSLLCICLATDEEETICDGEFDVSVYRKPTVSGVLLHWDSVEILSWKQGLINGLLRRGSSYSFNDLFLKTEINFFISLFKRNGYPILHKEIR